MKQPTNIRTFITALMIACCYYISGRLGLLLSIPPGFATSIWPPSGIALAGVLLGGYRVWPGVFIGSFLINTAIAFDNSSTVALLRSVAVGSGIAMGASLQALIGAWLVSRKVPLPTLLEKEEDVFYLIVLGGVISCLINATISTTILHIIGAVPSGKVLTNLLTWWIGDSIGVMIFSPLLLMLFVPKDTVSLFRKLLVTVPLTLLFSGVVGVFIYAKHAELLGAQQDINRKMSDQTNSLQQYMDHMAMYLHSVDTFYQAENTVSRKKFQVFVQYMLQNHTDIAALEWVPRVKASQRKSFEAQARADGLQDFQFWQKSPQNSKIPVTSRDEYYPVYYLEPYAPNVSVAGFDLASESTRHFFLQQAIDQNKLITTSPLHLIQDPVGDYAVIYYQAIFPPDVPLNTVEERRKAVTGFAVAVLHVGTAIKTALGNTNQQDLNLRVEDITIPNAPQVLYDSATNDQALVHTETNLVSSSSILVGGRTWQLTFRTSPTALNRSNWALWAVLIGGMFFTGLFGTLLLITTGRNDVVRRLVDQRTEELRKSEGHFELAITGASVGVWDWDIISGEMYWSPILNKIFGITDKNFSASFDYFENRLHPDDRQRTVTEIRRHLDESSNKSAFDIEYRLRKDDGQYVWIYTHGQTLWNEYKPVRMAGSILDITNRKQAEQALAASEAFLRTSMEYAPIGMALVALDGKFLRVNKALCNLIGFSEAECLALDFQTITHPEDLAVDEEYIQLMLKRTIETYKMEKRYLHKDGHAVWVLLSVSLISDAENKPLYFVAQIQDISERKQADIVKQDLLQKLADSNTELERFAYVASHDLQEPLRMISGFSDIIQHDYGNLLDADGKHYLSIIIAASERMREMVKDLLEYARLDKGVIRKAMIDSEATFHHVLENLTKLIRERSAEISADPIPPFQGNALQFMRLLQNLISNAIKYQPAGQKPVITLHVQDQGKQWLFSITDNGIGVDESFTQTVFEPFRRLHSWDEIKGSGMGLAVCKKIVENHGGTIWMTSTPGQGSIVWFTIAKLEADQTA